MENRADTPADAGVTRVSDRSAFPGFVPISDRAYWIIFAAIILAGAGLRAFWTSILGAPFLTPDTESYIQPILSHTWLPLSEMRTAGLPLFYLLCVGLASNPIGMLVGQNVLALACAALLALSVKRYLGLRWFSLGLLLFLLFNGKGLFFEYYAMSEHFSTMLYLIYAAAILALFKNPGSLRLAAVLGVLVYINIMVKPSALVLIPATLILYGFCVWRERGVSAKRLVRAGTIFIVIVAVGTAGYLAAFRHLYGDYQLSHFDGYNLFAHAGQFNDLSGPEYAGIKSELRPLMAVYRSKYAAVANYQPDWMVYGSTDKALRRDFGNQSPAAIIDRYAARHRRPGEAWYKLPNEIYSYLAFEGIREHPAKYIAFALDRFRYLLGEGYSYNEYAMRLPSLDKIDVHRASLVEWRKMLSRYAHSQLSSECSPAAERSKIQQWPLQVFLSGALNPCASPAYDRPEIRQWAGRMQHLQRLIAAPLQRLFDYMPLLTLLSIFVLWPGMRHGSRQKNLLHAAGFFGLCCLLYCILLAFFNTTEPARFLANVQPLMVLSMGLVILVGGMSLRRRVAQWQVISAPGTATGMLLRRLISHRNLLFWAGFAGILSLGIAFRVCWTLRLGIPYITPDTESYIAPAIQHPWFPFSEMRTGGLPMFYLAAVSAAGSPAGMLIAQNLLAGAASAILAWTIRHYLGLRVFSLTLLVFLLFNAKSVSFEYYAMSEHLSAMLYLLYAAVAIASFRSPGSRRIAIVLGILIFLNILAKPSAVVLIPATLLLYGLHVWRMHPYPVRYVIRPAAIFAATVCIGIGAYMMLFRIQYGDFQISHYDGYNLFSHVGQLTDLDGPSYPDIKRRLRPMIEKYRAKYVAHDDLEPNWLIFGSTNAKLAADFHNESPVSVIREYVDGYPESDRLKESNKIFLGLAVEGIASHPREYLALVEDSFFGLLRDGYDFTYYRTLPSRDTVSLHDSDIHTWAQILFGLARQPVPLTCNQAIRVRNSTSWPLRGFIGGVVLPCRSVGLYGARWSFETNYADRLFNDLSVPLRWIFERLPKLAIFGAIAMCIAYRECRRYHDMFIMGLFFILCWFGYAVLVALVNTSEPARFLDNVQDLMVLSMALISIAGFASLAVMIGNGEYFRSWYGQVLPPSAPLVR